MRELSKCGLAATLLLSVPFLARAQRTGSAMGQAMTQAPVAVHAHPAAARPGSAGVARSTSRKTTSLKANNANGFLGDPLSVQQLLDPFPGFGFNFEYLNAIDSDLGIKALIDPVTQGRLALAERLSNNHFASPGFYILDGGGAYAVPSDSDASDQQAQASASAPQQPQIIVVQQPMAQQPAPDSSAPQEAVSAPLPDEGEFTLVLRNGSQIQAVAFTRAGDKIVYITPEGGRRSIAASALDADATEQTNQENGTPLQLPHVILDLNATSPRADM
jgi:hypothetical protein